MAILYGMGRPIITTVVAGQKVLLPIEPMSFQLTPSVDLVKSTKFNVDGQVVTAGSAKRRVEWQLTLGIEAITWAVIQMALGEIEQTTTNKLIADLKFATLPATGTQTISDAEITDITKVQAAIYGDNKPTYLSRLASGTPAAGQFVAATGSLTFPASIYAGKTVGYRIDKTVATCQSIGVEANPTLLTQFGFEGILKTDSPGTITKISIDLLKAESEPTVNVQGVTKFDLVYTLVTPAGKPRPFELMDIAI